MAASTSKGKREPSSLRRVFVDDLFKTRLDKDYLRELRDLYHFYLSDEDRRQLAQMGRLRRAFMLLGWTLKNMLTRLSPPRRLAILVALVMAILGETSVQVGGNLVTVDLRFWAVWILLLVLMLELKDKLVARDEIEIARQVQLALLPHVDPTIAGWKVWSHSRPAREVGGDLVDYLELDGFRHGVLLGDVAGKGLGAAMLSAKLQATFRALVPDSVALDELGNRVNAIFVGDNIQNRYATLFYTVLEHDSTQMRYINAGHNPAYLLRGAVDSTGTTNGLEELCASSYPIGMFDPADYEERVVEMRSGDLLLIYSDGLTEATNARGEEFGEDRLRALLPALRGHEPAEVGKRLMREVDAFLGDATQNDDLSLVVVRKS